MNPEQIRASEILDNDEHLQAFANLASMSLEAARALLERMLREPEFAAQANDYIWGKERSEDFKGYVAGEEKGYARGHEAGFAKGAVIGALAGIATAAATAIVIAAKLKP
ncbi:hypothetical protein [Geopseudomonas aromaticivorans]